MRSATNPGQTTAHPCARPPDFCAARDPRRDEVMIALKVVDLATRSGPKPPSPTHLHRPDRSGLFPRPCLEAAAQWATSACTPLITVSLLRPKRGKRRAGVEPHVRAKR